MAGLFSVNMLSSDRTIFTGLVRSLIAPGKLGYFGILPNHAPFMTTLMPGKFKLVDESGKTITFDSKTSGFFRLLKNKADILLEPEDAHEKRQILVG